MKRIIIFDLDGTLYDKTGLARRLVWKQLLRGCLHLLVRERKVRRQLRGLHFVSEEAFYDAFFAGFPCPEKARRWYFEQYMPDMAAVLRKHYRMAQWLEWKIPELRDKGQKIVVFSDYGFVREKLAAIGFDSQWADLVVDAPSLGGLKPCRESFEKICQMMNAQPSECLMVGDRDDTDGEGARAVGMAFERVTKAWEPNTDRG